MGVKGGLTVLSNFEFLQGVIVRLMRAAGFLVLLCYFCVFPGQYLMSGGKGRGICRFFFLIPGSYRALLFALWEQRV